MANLKPVGAGKTLNLAQLNSWLQQTERLLGPLVSIGLSPNGETVGQFDMDQPRPSKLAKLDLSVGGHCVVGSGSTLVCSGRANISSVATDVCATRQA